MRREQNQGTNAMRKIETDHGHESEGGTGLLQHSSSFVDREAGKTQHMMVFSLVALLNLFLSGNVSL